MDNLLEILVPLIFAAVYFIGNLLSNKAPKPGGEGKQREGGPTPAGEPQPSNDWEDQQRRIREEIRRKIAERRGEPVEEAPQPAEPTIFAETRSAEPAEAEEPAAWDEPEAEPVVAWEPDGNVFENEMQERLRQIEETKRKAEALRRQAKVPQKAESAASGGTVLPSASLAAGPVRTQLLNTENARAAFIYAEVFGAPASLREPGPRIPAQQKMAS